MVEQTLNELIAGNMTTKHVVEAVEEFGSPLYVYVESILRGNCREIKSMPHAFGFQPRFAMKANPLRAILQIIDEEGIDIDAASVNEVARAFRAGFDYDRIMLTSIDVPQEDKHDVQRMMLAGLKYNVCSWTQLQNIGDFVAEHHIPLSMRIHPGEGSGESRTRNTGDKYSPFGVHLKDLPQLLHYAKEKGVIFNQVHVHIGSGGDPKKWRENIDRELSFVENSFPDANRVNFGGGLKVARMPNEVSADIKDLGAYAKERIESFYERTGRKLIMEVEPGTYIIANAGFIVTEVKDKKSTGSDGYLFLIVNGGMELNSRPLLYGSVHPFFVVSKAGDLLSSEFRSLDGCPEQILVGRCCESGDSQCLDAAGNLTPRRMGDPEIGDMVVIGGAGAYCSSMAPSNYNSYVRPPQILLRTNGERDLIEKQQWLHQIIQNELPLRKLA